MGNFFSSLSAKINSINEWVGRTTAWLTAILMIVVCFDVVARKVFSFTKTWIMDIEWHLFALVFLLAAGYTLKHEKHVRVDLFYARFSKKDKAETDFWGTLVFLIPWCIAVMTYTFSYAKESFLLNEGAPDPGGLPYRYVIKFAVVLGMILLFLQGISMLIDNATMLFKKNGNQKTGAQKPV